MDSKDIFNFDIQNNASFVFLSLKQLFPISGSSSHIKIP